MNAPIDAHRSAGAGRRTHRGGASLIEVLVGLLIVVIASVATLSYFAFALGGINKQGNRRAALERGRAQLEQLMDAPITRIQPADGQPYWLTCAGTPCTWTLSAVRATQSVTVDDLPSQTMETTVQWVDDPSAGTATNDTLALGVKVWFTASAADDDFNRVYVRTLRTP